MSLLKMASDCTVVSVSYGSSITWKLIHAYTTSPHSASTSGQVCGTCGGLWLHRGGRYYQQFSFLQVRLTYDTDTNVELDQIHSRGINSVCIQTMPMTSALPGCQRLSRWRLLSSRCFLFVILSHSLLQFRSVISNQTLTHTSSTDLTHSPVQDWLLTPW